MKRIEIYKEKADHTFVVEMSESGFLKLDGKIASLEGLQIKAELRIGKIKCGGINITEEHRQLVQSWLDEEKTKSDEEMRCRDADRPAPLLDESKFFTYSYGCDTGLIYPEAERRVIELALENGAQAEKVYRGSRDKSRAFPGTYDAMIPAYYVIGEKAEGYENVWCEDVYAIPLADFNAAKEEIEKLKAAKKAIADAKTAEMNAKEAAELATMTPAQVATKLFTEQIHVDEDGEFSDCEPWCDDCIWYSVWAKDAPQDVRAAAETLEVGSKKGKVYTYRTASEKSAEIFAARHADLIEKARAEKIAQLSA